MPCASPELQSFTPLFAVATCVAHHALLINQASHYSLKCISNAPFLQAEQQKAAADAAAAAGAKDDDESPYYSVDPTPALPAATPMEELQVFCLTISFSLFYMNFVTMYCVVLQSPVLPGRLVMPLRALALLAGCMQRFDAERSFYRPRCRCRPLCWMRRCAA